MSGEDPVAPRTWVLTGSPENVAATRDRGYTVIGMKERRRRLAEAMLPGDRIVFYVTRIGAFAGSIRLTSDMFEDREPIWPGKPGNPDSYPWRFRSEPEIALEESEWVLAEAVKDRLEHVRKWPDEHWKLAFQGQLRMVSEHDADVLLTAMRERAAARR